MSPCVRLHPLSAQHFTGKKKETGHWYIKDSACKQTKTNMCKQIAQSSGRLRGTIDSSDLNLLSGLRVEVLQLRLKLDQGGSEVKSKLCLCVSVSVFPNDDINHHNLLVNDQLVHSCHDSLRSTQMRRCLAPHATSISLTFKARRFSCHSSWTLGYRLISTWSPIRLTVLES